MCIHEKTTHRMSNLKLRTYSICFVRTRTNKCERYFKTPEVMGTGSANGTWNGRPTCTIGRYSRRNNLSDNLPITPAYSVPKEPDMSMPWMVKRLPWPSLSFIKNVNTREKTAALGGGSKLPPPPGTFRDYDRKGLHIGGEGSIRTDAHLQLFFLFLQEIEREGGAWSIKFSLTASQRRTARKGEKKRR